MTNSPLSPRAAALLADRRWRLRNSLWMVMVPLFSCLVLPWVGFLYVAIRMRTNRLAWVCTLVFALLQVAIIVVLAFTPAEGEPGYSADSLAQGMLSMLVVVLALVTWGGAIVMALFVNQQYLRWRASTLPWYENEVREAAAGRAPQPLVPPTWVPGAPNAPATNVDGQLPEPLAGAAAAGYWAPAPPASPVQVTPGVGPVPPQPPLPTTGVAPAAPAPPRAPTVVDVNSCTAAELVDATGIAASAADTIVSIRESSGSYTSFEDLVARTSLMPHVVVHLRGMEYRNPRPADNRPPSRGRRIDY